MAKSRYFIYTEQKANSRKTLTHFQFELLERKHIAGCPHTSMKFPLHRAPCSVGSRAWHNWAEEKLWYMPNLSLIIDITESNFQHALVVERLEDRRGTTMQNEVTLYQRLQAEVEKPNQEWQRTTWLKFWRPVIPGELIKSSKKQKALSSWNYLRFPPSLMSSWSGWRRNPKLLSIYSKEIELTCENVKFPLLANWRIYLPPNATT